MRKLLLVLLLSAMALGQPAGPATYDVSALAFSPTGRYLAAGDYRNQTVRLFETKTGKVLWTRKLTGWVRSLAFSHDGYVVLAGLSDVDNGGQGRAELLEVSNGETTGQLKDADAVTCVQFSPDDHYLALGDATGVILWDVPSNSQARLLESPEGVASLAFSPQGLLIAAGDGKVSVHLWEVASGQKLERPMVYEKVKVERVHSLAFSPDGKQLASLGEYPQVWEVATGKSLKALGGDQAHSGLAWSPDGALLAVTGDHPTQLWDTKSYQKTELGDQADGLKSAVAFSPDGTLATGLVESIALWDVKAKKKLSTLTMQP